MCESYNLLQSTFFIYIIPYLIGVVNRCVKICHIFLHRAVLINE